MAPPRGTGSGYGAGDDRRPARPDRGAWSGRGKWAPRVLKTLDAQLAAEFDAAFRLAGQGDGARLLALADRELALHGGRYFDGYRQNAPLEARRLE